MLTCKQVVHLTSSAAVAGKADKRRFSVRLHLLMCHHCRAYVTALRRIADMVRQPGFTGDGTDNQQRSAIVGTVLRELGLDV